MYGFGASFRGSLPPHTGVCRMLLLYTPKAGHFRVLWKRDRLPQRQDFTFFQYTAIPHEVKCPGLSRGVRYP
jgi:hypothetical protein